MEPGLLTYSQQSFFKAAYFNNKQILCQSMAREDMDINAWDNYGIPAIYHAISRRNFDISLTLLKRPDLEVVLPFYHQENLLHVLCNTQKTTFYENSEKMCLIAKELTKKRIDINEQNRYKKTPLLIALEKYKPLNFIECLIDQGAAISRIILIQTFNLPTPYLRTILKSRFIGPYDLIYMLELGKRSFENSVRRLVLMDLGDYELEGIKESDDKENDLIKEKMEACKAKWERECKKLKKQGRIIKCYYQTMCDLNYRGNHPLFWKKDRYTKAVQLIAYYAARDKK